MNKRNSSKRLHPDEEPSSSGEQTDHHDKLACYICGKLYQSGKARTLHLKMCARSKGISTPELLALIKRKNNLTKQEDKELRNNRELLAECDELFKKQPSSKGGNITKKKRTTYYDPVVAMQEEELQMALAISASLCEQETYFQQPEVPSKQAEANESLLSPAAPASSKFVESRTDTLLCPAKPSYDDNKDNYFIISEQNDGTRNTEHVSSPENARSSLSPKDSVTTAGKTGEMNETTQTSVDVVRVTNCSVNVTEVERCEDNAVQKFTMWNATSYSENESTEFFYVLPLYK